MRDAANDLAKRLITLLDAFERHNFGASASSAMPAQRGNKGAMQRSLLEKQMQRLPKKKKRPWSKQARPEQLPPPGDWFTWIILAGRGFGKTRTGAETIRHWVRTGKSRRIGLIGQTIHATRQIMVQGESGLQTISKDDERPTLKDDLLTWPNGATATLYSGDHYEKLRGPQFDTVWIDEFAKFRAPQKTWEQVMMCLRLGKHPRCIVTTTPRPIPFLQHLLTLPDVVSTHGSTFDNAANLAPGFLAHLKKNYEGSTLGQQELYAQFITPQHTGLWTPDLLSRQTIDPGEIISPVVLAMDPAVTWSKNSDETGFILAAKNVQGHFVVLKDLSGHLTPREWITTIGNVRRDHKNLMLVVEVNQGGEALIAPIREAFPTLLIKTVRATTSKMQRALSVLSLYEQGRIIHKDNLFQLEQQLLNFHTMIETRSSPDRVDALCLAIQHLYQFSPQPFLNIFA